MGEVPLYSPLERYRPGPARHKDSIPGGGGGLVRGAHWVASLMRNCFLVRPYRRLMPKVLGGS